VLPVGGKSPGELVRGGSAGCQSESRRLEHGQRGELRKDAGCVQGDHASVRMPTEMITTREALGDPGRLLLEVDALFGTVRRVAGPVEHDQLVVDSEGTLCRPGGLAVANAAVNEDESFHPARP
jgi:hypothetical protein